MTGNDDAHRPCTDDELDAAQLAAMDAVWRARRYDGVLGDEAARIEVLIRTGRVAAARKLLTTARRAARERIRSTGPDGTDRDDRDDGAGGAGDVA